MPEVDPVDKAQPRSFAMCSSCRPCLCRSGSHSCTLPWVGGGSEPEPCTAFVGIEDMPDGLTVEGPNCTDTASLVPGCEFSVPSAEAISIVGS